MAKATMQDIADALNTSRITVWKALNNRPGVSAALRAEIQRKAQELGYTKGGTPAAAAVQAIKAVPRPDVPCSIAAFNSAGSARNTRVPIMKALMMQIPLSPTAAGSRTLTSPVSWD